MRVAFVFVLLAVLPFCGFATKISCSNIEYAGERLIFYTQSEPISNEKEQLFVLNFDAQGKSEANIPIEGTVFTYCDFGVYRGMLMLEATKTHDIKLPPLRKKSFAERKNPYFQPVSFWFLTEKGNMLTDKISDFEQLLNRFTNNNFDNLYLRQSMAVFDSLKMKVEEAFPGDAPKAFVYHKKQRLKFIEADAFRLKSEDYAGIFNGITSGYWGHDAFSALFNKAFDEQLNFLVVGTDGKKISAAIANEDIKVLLQFVSDKFQVSGKVSELALLKMLYDGYYSRYFSKKSIKEMISSDFFMKNGNRVIRQAANNIIKKFTFMEKGIDAPVICLNDLSGEKVCSNTKTDKCKYIVFADEEMVVCKEQLKYLSKIDELFAKHLDIFVVLRNTDRAAIDKFFSENKISGTITIDTDNKYIEQYKVKSFPKCVLLDENHHVIKKEAKSPLDGFEQDFGNWLRNELFMRQRNR